MSGGILVGYLFRNVRLKGISSLSMVLIWMLLFILGVDVGGNEAIINNLGTLGLESLLLACAATFGSIVFAYILWKISLRRAAGGKLAEAVGGKDERNSSAGKSEKQAGGKGSADGVDLWKGFRGSLLIFGFFVAGVLFGLFGLAAAVPFSFQKLSTAVLWVMMFCVGLSVGNDGAIRKSIRKLNPVYAFLPLMTILGTWAGSAFCVPFLQGRTLTDCLAVGSGMGYYSLSSIVITEAKGADLGTVALLSNIAREIMTLLLAPLLVKAFGKLSPIAAGGCTTADTTLPVITKVSGKEFAVVSVYHGVVTDFLTPFMVTLFCAL